MEQRLHFDTVARLYESARPGYRAQLFDDLLWFSRTPAGGSVVDIGCGTGKSTEPFARRGFSVCALDPGANMLAVCKEKLHTFPNVRYEQSAFETWSVSGQLFDLAVSGTAFHWIGQPGHAKLVSVLQPGGAVGIFWHTYLTGRDPFYNRLDDIYREYAPDLYVTDLRATQELSDRTREEQLLSWDGFTDWRVIRYYDNVRYDANGYLDLLRTWSTHVNLPEPFYQAVSCSIRDAGGHILKPVRTTLCCGRRG